jgi:hypothetical protein
MTLRGLAGGGGGQKKTGNGVGGGVFVNFWGGKNFGCFR